MQISTEDGYRGSPGGWATWLPEWQAAHRVKSLLEEDR